MMDRTVTVMTWNVRYFGHGTRGLWTTDAQIQRAAEALASMEPIPDVVCLQEIETRSLRAGMHEDDQLDRFLPRVNKLLEARGVSVRYEAHHFPAHRYELGFGPPLYTTGLAMLLARRHDAQAVHVDEITHRRGVAFSGLKQARIAAHLQVGLHGGGEIDVFNVHLSLPAFLTRRLHRLVEQMGEGNNQMAEVQSLLGFTESHRDRHPAVVVGDFNAVPGSSVYQAMTEAGFVDALGTSLGLDPTALCDWHTSGFLHVRHHLDHVFSSTELEVLDTCCTHPFGQEGPFDGLSDHNPLIVRFRLPG